MIEKIEGIVIGVVKHSDRHNVVTLYTRTRGRVSFLSSASKGKVGKMRSARIMPLAYIAADVKFSGSRDLQMLPAVAPVRVWHTLYFSPVKSSLVFFLAEFLNNLLRNYPTDEQLWLFIRDSICFLDETDERKLANFHIAFLVRMLPFLGINPPVDSYKKGDYFNMEKADFLASPIIRNSPNLLLPAEAAFLPLLERISLANHHRFRFDSETRARILNLLLRYYSLHLSLPPKLKTLPILNTLFS